MNNLKRGIFFNPLRIRSIRTAKNILIAKTLIVLLDSHIMGFFPLFLSMEPVFFFLKIFLNWHLINKLDNKRYKKTNV